MIFFSYLKIFFSGIAMGAADVIPGVSGGTIAFILGIYDRLINAIHEITAISFIKKLFTGKVNIFKFLRSENMLFLISLFAGIIAAILSLSSPIEYLLNNHAIYIWSAFFGLILGSIFFVTKSVDMKKASNIVAILIGGIGAYFLVGMLPAQTSNSLWFICLCGAIAICAMILPGISGSFILLILGKYDYILGAIHNFKSAIFEKNIDLVLSSGTILLVFLIGVLIGLSLFIKLLSILLSKYHNVTISLLIGFMAGSLRKIWPFKLEDGGNYFPNHFNMEIFWSIFLVILGIITVIILELFSQHKNKEI